MSYLVRICTVAALATSLLASPAFAQFTMGDKEKSGPEQRDEARAKRNAEIEKQYNSMRKHTDETPKTIKVDPWQNMRAPTANANR